MASKKQVLFLTILMCCLRRNSVKECRKVSKSAHFGIKVSFVMMAGSTLFHGMYYNLKDTHSTYDYFCLKSTWYSRLPFFSGLQVKWDFSFFPTYHFFLSNVFRFKDR
jgi:hypothetical protein